jgi:hypothetical protein
MDRIRCMAVYTFTTILHMYMDSPGFFATLIVASAHLPDATQKAPQVSGKEEGQELDQHTGPTPL